MNHEDSKRRYIIYGSGAVGCTIGARLWRENIGVTLVARGEHGRHLQEKGLHFLTPELDEVLQIPTVTDVSEIDFNDDTVVLLCVKSQHTQMALEQLASSAPAKLPICCVQNGVSNERLALRFFSNVYATLVNLPAMYLSAGEVASYVTGVAGVLDTGQFPSGVDVLAKGITQDLRRAGFAATADSKVMRKKYAKLLMNLGNAVQAIITQSDGLKSIYQSLRKEAEECYLAEALEWASRQEMSDIAEGLIMGKVPGYEITAGSSWQSLKRSTGDIETEYLNGEISLLGRMNKISTPYNDFLVILAREFVRDRRQPGSMPLEEFLTRFDFFRSKG